MRQVGGIWTPFGVQGSTHRAPPLSSPLSGPSSSFSPPSPPDGPLPSSPGSTGDWSSEGCFTEPGAQATVCRCDHLTFFALLLVTPLPTPSTFGGAQTPVLGGGFLAGAMAFGGRWAWPPADGVLVGGVAHRGRPWTRPLCRPSCESPRLAVAPPWFSWPSPLSSTWP